MAVSYCESTISQQLKRAKTKHGGLYKCSNQRCAMTLWMHFLNKLVSKWTKTMMKSRMEQVLTFWETDSSHPTEVPNNRVQTGCHSVRIKPSAQPRRRMFNLKLEIICCFYPKLVRHTGTWPASDTTNCVFKLPQGTSSLCSELKFVIW